jgi:hypothetical protein
MLPWRNPLFFPFLSHKLARLLVPWCLILVLATSLSLSFRGSGFFTFLLGLQAAFYALAGVGWLKRNAQRRPRLLSVPYALVLLNLAAAAALPDFLFGRQTAAWRASS